MINDMNEWRISARIESCEYKDFGGGRGVYNIKLARRPEQGSGIPALVDCESQFNPGIEYGSPVIAFGMFGLSKKKDGSGEWSKKILLDIHPLICNTDVRHEQRTPTPPTGQSRLAPAPRPPPPQAVPYSVPDSDVPAPWYPPAKTGQAANDDQIPF